MTDRPDTILLQGIRLEGRHGATDDERSQPQELEVDLVVEADLRAAAAADDWRRRSTTDRSSGSAARWWRSAATGCWRRSRAPSRRRSWARRESLAVTVRVRKLAVPIDADLDFAQVEIHRSRPAGGATV